jgi:hypothetical protein
MCPPVTAVREHLHAAITVFAADRPGLERLCRYVLRPPVAQDRLLLRYALVRSRLFSPHAAELEEPVDDADREPAMARDGRVHDVEPGPSSSTTGTPSLVVTSTKGSW